MCSRAYRLSGRRLPPSWSAGGFWALLQAGYEAAKQDGTPRVQIVDAIMASLTEGTINANQA